MVARCWSRVLGRHDLQQQPLQIHCQSRNALEVGGVVHLTSAHLQRQQQRTRRHHHHHQASLMLLALVVLHAWRCS